MPVSDLSNSLANLSAQCKRSSTDLWNLSIMAERAKYGILSAKELAVEADNIMKGIAQNALHTGQALQTQSQETSDLVSKAIKGHKDLENLAGTSVGGYLDQIAQVYAALNDPKNKYDVFAQAAGQEYLKKIGAIINRFGLTFNTDSFIKLLQKAMESDPVQKAIETGANKGAQKGTSGVLAPFMRTNNTDIKHAVSTGQIRG